MLCVMTQISSHNLPQYFTVKIDQIIDLILVCDEDQINYLVNFYSKVIDYRFRFLLSL
jgi:hypothetical protein